MELIFTSMFIAGLAFVVAVYWRVVLAALFLFAVGCVFIARCSHADTLRFEVSAIVESDEDRATMQDAIAYAARIFRDQFNADLVVTYVDTSTVAGHTKAEALLDAVKAYRVNRPEHRAADATVLFTRRELRGHAGIATIGPACSAQASAVVAIRNDGYDGQLLAHELLHTVGVPHDHDAGYLMSESPSRAGVDTASLDSVLTFKGANVGECMAIAKDAPAPAASQPSGGGGGMSEGLLVFLCVAAALRQWFRAERKEEAADHWERKYRQLRRGRCNCDAGHLTT